MGETLLHTTLRAWSKLEAETFRMDTSYGNLSEKLIH